MALPPLVSKRLRAHALRRILALALGTASLGQAQIPARAPERAEAASARAHFDRALELYRAGKYAQARDELQSAAELDPAGKDLFFNLALVQEKLGALGDAITALERFRELEDDAAERERARLTIERLRGAQQAALAQPAASAAAPAPCPVLAPVVPAPARGPSPALIGAAATSLAALVVGTVFGVKALADDVGDERTSTSLSVAQMRERARRAEREALVADVAFAVAAASATTFVTVWLLTPKDSARGAGLSWIGRF